MFEVILTKQNYIKGLSTTLMSWWWVLLPLKDYLWWSEGGRGLLGHCFPTMRSTLTEAIELLRPFLVANSFRTASQLHLDHHCWLGSLILLPELSALDKDESTTIMHPQLLSGAKASCILGPIWNLLKVLNSAKKKSTVSPGIYPPWEVTILLSLILTSFCHIWNVKVLACLPPESAEVPHILIMCNSHHRCIVTFSRWSGLLEKQMPRPD